MTILSFTTISDNLVNHATLVWSILAIIMFLAIVGIVTLAQTPLYDDADIARDIEQNNVSASEVAR